MRKIDREIQALCEAKGLTFRPWEFPPPWEVGDREDCPYPAATAGAEWWPKLLALRAALKKELRSR